MLRTHFAASPGLATSRSRQPRRVANVPLILANCALLIVGAPAAHVWHTYQMGRIAGSLLAHADRREADEQWSDAARCLHRYLQLQPEDVEARIRLAQTFDRSAQTRERMARAVDLYYRALGVAPHRADLRGRLARLLLELGSVANARRQADQLLVAYPDDELGQAVRALSLYSLARSGQVPMDEAALRLREAVDRQPGNIELVQSLAEAYWNHMVEPSLAERQQEASRAMDRMVEARGDSAEAYLARCQFRERHGLGGAESDLRHALELSPQQPAVLHAAASFYDRDQQYTKAVVYWKQLIQIVPTHLDGYLSLGECYLALGRQDDAIATWRQGLRISKDHLRLNLRLADLLIEQNEWEEVGSLLAIVEKTMQSIAAGQTIGELAPLRPAADILRARWHVRQGQFSPAMALARRVLSAPHDSVLQNGHLRLQSWLILAESYSAREEWDRVASCYERAAALRGEPSATRLAAANAWAAAGKLDLAFEQCRLALESQRPPSRAWLLLARLELRNQRRKVQHQRSWEMFENALTAARKALPQSWEVPLLEIDYLVERGDDPQTLAGAADGLRSLESQHGDQPLFWRQLSLTYDRLGRNEDANRALARLGELDGSQLNAALLRAELLARRGKLDQAKEMLLAARDAGSSEQQRARAWMLARLERHSNCLTAAQKHLVEYLESQPSDLATIRRLLELALETSDLAEAQRWEQRLEEMEGPDGCCWRMYKAWRLLAEARDTQDVRFAQAVGLQVEIERRRPYWSGGAALRGLLAEYQEQRAAAIDAYQAAIYAGTHQAAIYDRLVRLLYGEGRLEEADRCLKRLADFTGLSPDLAALEVAIATGLGQSTRAIELARKAAEQDSSDGVARIRLSQLLLLDGQTTEAEAELRKAAALHPGNPLVWKGLIAFYVKTRQVDAAVAVLEQLARSNDLPLLERTRLMAGGYLLSGLPEKADRLFRMAERLAPNDEAVLAEYTAFLLERDPAAAEEKLRVLVQLDPDKSQWRRTLAQLLARQKTDSAYEEALQLLDREGTHENGMPLDEIRLMAELLARRATPAAVERARYLMETVLTRTDKILPEDRLRLALLYEAQEKPQLARNQYRALYQGGRLQLSHLVAYVKFLLRQEDADEAVRLCVDRWAHAPQAELAQILVNVLLVGHVAEHRRTAADGVLAAAIQRFGDDAPLQFLLGNLRLKENLPDAAISHLECAIDLDPQHAMAWNNLAAVLAERPEQRQTALECINRGLEAAGRRDALLLDTKAMVLLYLGEVHEAVALLEEVVSKPEATDPRFHFHLSLAYQRINSLEQSKAALGRARALGLADAFLSRLERDSLSQLVAWCRN